VPITQEGSNEFVLTAYNAKQETVRQTVTVKGIKGSKARVISARVTPTALEAEGGTAVLEWQVTNAVRIELVIDGVTQVLAGATGTLDLPVTKTTKLKLVAYDDEGLTLAREFVVTVKPPANPQGRTPEDNGPPQPKQNPPLDGGTKTDPPSSGERP
jgi:redox-sensitive bicupin YhaK (pirin superfamily)